MSSSSTPANLPFRQAQRRAEPLLQLPMNTESQPFSIVSSSTASRTSMFTGTPLSPHSRPLLPYLANECWEKKANQPICCKWKKAAPPREPPPARRGARPPRTRGSPAAAVPAAGSAHPGAVLPPPGTAPASQGSCEALRRAAARAAFVSRGSFLLFDESDTPELAFCPVATSFRVRARCFGKLPFWETPQDIHASSWGSRTLYSTLRLWLAKLLPRRSGAALGHGEQGGLKAQPDQVMATQASDWMAPLTSTAGDL
ncbi:uncharacterized protein LOC128782271 [Vidua chalybeata]|uniref:uncharacterized protein LOC128782271 n=1 Tax=Vidua chalybeata TaxID=81927 RepID=UPI0023A7E251|nr:uncharacterized protein LOC128782271 [Vidua chalybeata]